MNGEYHSEKVEMAVSISLGEGLKDKSNQIRRDTIKRFNDYLYEHHLTKTNINDTNLGGVQIHFEVNTRNYLYIKYTFYYPNDLDMLKRYKSRIVRLLSVIIAQQKLTYRYDKENINLYKQLWFCLNSLPNAER